MIKNIFTVTKAGKILFGTIELSEENVLELIETLRRMINDSKDIIKMNKNIATIIQCYEKKEM